MSPPFDVAVVMDYPVLLALFSFAVMVAVAHAGAWMGGRRAVEPETREQFGVVPAATLNVLGLIIGFTFSMARNRYDQRKNYAEAEANAIGTACLRADLLGAEDAGKVRALLRRYLALRIVFYLDHDEAQLHSLATETDRMEDALWSAVRPAAQSQPNAVVALAVAGMNDVLNSEGYTKAAWWNRIPFAAWSLIPAVALCCNALVGLGASGLESVRICCGCCPWSSRSPIC